MLHKTTKMEDIRTFNDISRNATTVPMVSPIPFETSSDQFYFSPISNQLQGTSPDMYWQYANDHRRSPYPNGLNNVGQYQYWRHSPFPTGDQMPMQREWSSSSPDNCNYQIPPWSMEAVSVVQGMNVHHGISQWSTGSARTCFDFSGSGDTSMNDIVMPTEFPREDQLSLEQENRYCNNFSASPWHQTNSAPLITELLEGEPRYSSCRWQMDGITSLCDNGSKELEKSNCTRQKKISETKDCKERQTENKNISKEIEDSSKIKKKKEISLLKQTQQKREPSRQSSRKPEAYNRQKKLQREREGLIRSAIQTLNQILPDDNKGKKLSKNLVLLKAIDHIKKLKQELGDTLVEGIDVINDEANDYVEESMESPHRKPKRRKKVATCKAKVKEKVVGSISPIKVCYNYPKLTSPPPTQSPSPPRATKSPPRAASNDYRNTDKQSLMLELLQDPAILTPSDTSSGSERAESPTSDEGSVHHEESISHVKRPMNAFLLFSKSNRENFKKLYPGKDNRRISTMLGEHWNTMKAEDKQPFQEMARELMRKTKETYPDFKYSPTEQSSKVKVFGSLSGEGSPRKGIRVGNHRLRSRSNKEKNHDSSISSDCNSSTKDIDVLDNEVIYMPNKNTSIGGNNTESKQAVVQGANSPHIQPKKNIKEKVANSNWDSTRCSRCDNWVQCDQCKKWRMLQDNINPESLPDKWFCWMSLDPRVNDCQVPEAMRWTDLRKSGILKDEE